MPSFYPSVTLGPGGAQAYDATLAAWAGTGAQGLPYYSAVDTVATLTLAADKGIYATGAGALATYDLSAFARTILDDANGAAVCTTIGAQGLDATLTALAGAGSQGLAYFSAADTVSTLTLAADKGIYATGAGALATFDLSSFSRTTLSSADASAWRTALAVVPGVNLQAYSATLSALATAGTPPSPWHTLGLWNGAMAWVIGNIASYKYDAVNTDPDNGSGLGALGNWSFNVVADISQADSGATALGRGRVITPGTASGAKGYVDGGGSVAPFRRDAGIRLTVSFSFADIASLRFFFLVDATTALTRFASDDISGNASFGVRHITGTDGTTFWTVRNAASGASTLADTGITITAGKRYTMSIYTIDASTMGIEIIEHGDAGAHTGTVTRFSYNTTLPTATASLCWMCGIRTTAITAPSPTWTHYNSSMQVG